VSFAILEAATSNPRDVPQGHGAQGHLDAFDDTCDATGVELELARVRLYDVDGDDVGLVELPAGSEIGPGNVLVEERGRLDTRDPTAVRRRSLTRG
jgi:hypothetical protein